VRTNRSIVDSLARDGDVYELPILTEVSDAAGLKREGLTCAFAMPMKLSPPLEGFSELGEQNRVALLHQLNRADE
jgi:hypothetical protein